MLLLKRINRLSDKSRLIICLELQKVSYLANVSEGIRSLHMQTLTEHVTKMTADTKKGTEGKGGAEKIEIEEEREREEKKGQEVAKRKKLKVES